MGKPAASQHVAASMYADGSASLVQPSKSTLLLTCHLPSGRWLISVVEQLDDVVCLAAADVHGANLPTYPREPRNL